MTFFITISLQIKDGDGQLAIVAATYLKECAVLETVQTDTVKMKNIA